MQVVPGLGECCAALRGSMRSEEHWDKIEFSQHLLSQEDLSVMCPKTAFLPPDPCVEPYLAGKISNFGVGDPAMSCPGRLANGRQRILLVTHREGIRDLTKLAVGVGETPVRNTPYCCVAKFRYEHAAGGGEAKKWSYQGMVHAGNPRGRRK